MFWCFTSNQKIANLVKKLMTKREILELSLDKLSCFGTFDQHNPVLRLVLRLFVGILGIIYLGG